MPVFEEDKNKKIENIIPEETKKQMEELQKQLAEKEKEIVRLKEKDTNFKKLREMTEDELDRMTEKEKELQRRQEKIEEDALAFKSKELALHKRSELARLSGGDAEAAKAIEESWSSIAGEENDREAITVKAEKALRLAHGVKAQSFNPVGAALNAGGSAPQKPKGKTFIETEDGEAMAAALNLPLK